MAEPNTEGGPPAFHRLLARQLNGAGVLPARIAEDPQLEELLHRISRAYTDIDRERYLNERSNTLASAELRALHAEISLRAGRRDAVLNTLSEGLINATPDGGIDDVNPAATRLLALPREALVGQQVADVLAGLDVASLAPGAAARRIAAAVASGSTWQVDRARLATRSGERHLDIAVSPIRDETDNLGSIVVLRDVTDAVIAERRRATLETQLRHGHKLQAVGQLASGVAHEFNNLLATIVSLSELLADQVGPDGGDDLTELRAAALRGAQLTRELLDFSQQHARPAADSDRVEVATKLEEAAARLRRHFAAGTEITVSVDPGVGAVLADDAGLDQILLNIGLNARDAISDRHNRGDAARGQLTLRARLAAADGRPGVAIAVVDNGSGMDASTAQRAFEPFFTTKEPGRGTGLGLASVYGLVQGMGGRISLRSAPGRGTQVSLWLPSPAPASTGPDAVPGPPAETAADPTGDTPDTSSDRETRPVVLVVDDEDGVRIGTKRLLERAGYDVLDATSALDALARHAATRIDVLLTDMVMPGGKSGLDLANALRHARPGLPVIYMSGYSSDAIGNGGVIEPGVPLLEKPFTRDQLLVVLDDVLTHSLG